VSIEAAYSRLLENISGLVRRDESMAKHTTYRTGGPADLFVIADTVSDLSFSIGVLDECGIEWKVLGKGSNVLVADSGYRGAVLVLGRDFRKHQIGDGHLIAGAGALLGHVVHDAYAAGLSGLEFAVGIPGTVGGALAMNAGSRDEWIGSLVQSVTLYTPENGLVRVEGHKVGWSYRYSDISSRGIALECLIRAETGDVSAIRRRMDASLSRRKRTQPIGLPCGGSVFKNPEGDSAGRLIEAAGLKGRQAGQAAISDVHANFIVNLGGAKASDVLRLMHDAREAVFDKFGIELEPEIRFMGSFS